MKKSKVISLAVLCLILIAALAVIAGKMSGITTKTGGDWTILASESSKDAAKTLQKSIESTGVVKVSIVTKVPESWSGRLILVGKTSQEPSKDAIKGLSADEYSVSFGKEYIIIAGGTDKATTEAVNYVCEKYESYLEEHHDYPFGSEYDYTKTSKEIRTATKRLLLNGVTIQKFHIVADGGEKNEAAAYLQSAVKNMIGTELTIVEKQGEDDYGIVIQSGKNGSAKDLKDQQFRIYQDESKLYLCAANPEQETLVVKMLLTKYMSYEYISNSSTESIVELSNVDFKFTCNWDEFTAPKAVQSRILQIPAEEGFSVLQGGCTDGTYGYYVMNNQDYFPYINRIYKVDLATMKVVQVSQTLDLQHANSITYNSKLRKLVCVNYDPDKTTLTYVDPDTLTVTGKTKADFNVLSLAYCEERNAYAAGTRGTFDWFALDGNMKVKDYYDSVQTDSIKQEVEMHKDKIIFSMSNPQTLYVYNWEGEFLYSIDMELYIEIENLVFYKDIAYTGYFSSGGVFYETIFYQDIQ